MTTKSEKQESMFSMIENWKNSGESQHSFCKAQGVPISVFQYWRKKYLDNQNPVPTSSAFVPVQISSSGLGSPVMELIFPDGKRINFYHTVEASYLRVLLS